MSGQAFLQPQAWQQLLTLAAMSAIVMGSPGPATISVSAVGAAFGLRGSLRYALGVVAGTIAVLLVVAGGVATLVRSLPALEPVLVAASAAYILYLAFRIATAPPLAASAERSGRPTFIGGAILALANPKAYVAIAAVLTSAGASGSGGTKIILLAVMIVAIHVVWLCAGAAFARFLRHPRASRIINLAFAAMLVLSTALALRG